MEAGNLEQELGGPFLQAAVFCEKILEEKDGVVSLVRVIDRVTVTAAGPTAPERMPPGGVLAVTGFLAFKSSFAKGSFEVKVTARSPSGQRLPDVVLPMFLEGDDRGKNLAFNATIHNVEAGLYWFDVSVGEKLVTRMPLRIVYQRMTGAAFPA